MLTRAAYFTLLRFIFTRAIYMGPISTNRLRSISIHFDSSLRRRRNSTSTPLFLVKCRNYNLTSPCHFRTPPPTVPAPGVIRYKTKTSN